VGPLLPGPSGNNGEDVHAGGPLGGAREVGWRPARADDERPEVEVLLRDVLHRITVVVGDRRREVQLLAVLVLRGAGAAGGLDPKARHAPILADGVDRRKAVPSLTCD